MKYLLVMHYAPPHIGGMETVLARQAHSLRELGHEVTIYTCRNDSKLPLNENTKDYRIVRARSLNFIEKKFNITYPIISPTQILSVFRLVKSSDVVHIHDVFYMSSHLAGIAARLINKPYYLTQHVAMVDHRNKFVMLGQKIVYATFGKLLFMGAKKIVVYNVNVKNFLLKLGVKEDKILLTNNGIDTEYFSPVNVDQRIKLRNKYDVPTNVPVIIFVGRLVSKKGYDVVYDANSDKHFTMIVGTGKVPNRMVQTKNIKFFGPATHAQLLDLYRLSDIFVIPAIGEIFTLVMQEAMACGLPIITTNDKGYDEYDLNKNLIRFIKSNAIDLRKNINLLLSDPSLLAQMSSYSRELAECQFSWSKNYEREYAIYDDSGLMI